MCVLFFMTRTSCSRTLNMVGTCVKFYLVRPFLEKKINWLPWFRDEALLPIFGLFTAEPIKANNRAGVYLSQ